MCQPASHTIAANARTGLIKITIVGFWTLADVDRFALDHAREILKVTAAGQPARTLIDYSRAAIQSQAVVAAFQNLALNPAARSIGVALYTTGSMARLQARRIAGVRDDMLAFEDLSDALTWLNSLGVARNAA